MEERNWHHLSINRVMMGLLIIVLLIDALGTWQNNRILKDRNALFRELQHEHAELLTRCGR